jgi:hypothetical protein
VSIQYDSVANIFYYRDTAIGYDTWGNVIDTDVYDGKSQSDQFGFGNLIHVERSCYGASSGGTNPTCTQDGRYAAHRTWVKNVLDQVTNFEYVIPFTNINTLALGQIGKEIDPNGQYTVYKFDGAGRLMKMYRPGDSDNSATFYALYYKFGFLYPNSPAYQYATQKIVD